MLKKRTTFWDVDTQFDFMRPEGALFVKGADKIIGKVSRIREFALQNGYSIIASMDWHSPDDQEISDTPDYKNTFPAHCISAQEGSSRVGYMGKVPIEYIENVKMDEYETKKLVDKEQFHIVIKKNRFDVFTNPNTIRLLNLVQPEKVVVFGVALDVCVYYAVKGLLEWGKSEVIVLKGGVKGLGIRKDSQILKEFEQQGVKIKELDDLEKEL